MSTCVLWSSGRGSLIHIPYSARIVQDHTLIWDRLTLHYSITCITFLPKLLIRSSLLLCSHSEFSRVILEDSRSSSSRKQGIIWWGKSEFTAWFSLCSHPPSVTGHLPYGRVCHVGCFPLYISSFPDGKTCRQVGIEKLLDWGWFFCVPVVWVYYWSRLVLLSFY